MCGISAIIKNHGTIFDPRCILDMSFLIKHRGPDDEGYAFINFNPNKISIYGGENTPQAVFKIDLNYLPQKHIEGLLPAKYEVALGHRRLSIVDLSPTGHQPMSYAGGRYWITYNGEVYNYLEIRNELISKGYSFISQSDTEVIMAAYDYWGKDCLHRFNGMFAFVLVDVEAQDVFIARDRFGVKPLYYWVSPNGFVAFGSEIKQFTILPGWVPSLNGQRVYDFLCFGLSDHTSETMFKAVYQLRGGQALHCKLNSFRSLHKDSKNGLPFYQWYDFVPNPFSGSLDEAVSQYRELFTDSVNLRLRSDVPVGSCLSGGLDSSSIVCVANELFKESGLDYSQKTFSACSHIEQFDERRYIEEVVAKTGVDAYYTYPSVERLFDEFDQIAWYQDEPFGSTSIYAQWLVFKLADNNGVKVMLDGQGGDEQLIGYHSFFKSYFAELFYKARFKTLFEEISAIRAETGRNYKQSIKDLAIGVLPFNFKNIISVNYLTPRWINSKTLKLCNKSFHEPFIFRNLQQTSAFQITDNVLPRLLHWEDRNSMACSVEARVPFIDYRLMEYALGLPNSYKLNHGVTKLVLRKSMKSILPEMIIGRKDKLGFVTPEALWIKEDFEDRFSKEISNTVEKTNGIINNYAVKYFDKVKKGEIPFSFTPWRIISFGKWFEIFSVK